MTGFWVCLAIVVGGVVVCGPLLFGMAWVAARMDRNHVQLGVLNGTWDEVKHRAE